VEVRPLAERGGSRVMVVVFASGDEAVGGLERVARDESVRAASFTAIGAFERAVLGYFDWERKDYRRIQVDEQVEVVSLTGNIAALPDGSPKIHAHAVLGTSEGAARCGHVLSGLVRPTLEVILQESPTSLSRRHDPATGLALIDAGGSG